jgi:hypothetical protein
VAPSDLPASGPFAPLLSALSGTGAQQMMHEMAEHLLSPSMLSRRTKLLMMATIARAMACPYCRGVATTLIVDDELSSADIADILDTLESPKLGPVEAKLLPFARATIRYEPYKMQERTAQLAAELGPELTLEAVGVTAMANMIVRLVMLLA